jgi:biopolymer transport protein ExbD
MSWRIRYEGSQTTVDIPTPQKVLEGVREGEWESTDEVRGPADITWTPIEEHPAFVEAIAELAEPPRASDEETHLDMNPLIDVALVLLIFFILTTSYASLIRTIEVPPEKKSEGGGAQLKDTDVQDRTFRVEAFIVDDQPRIRVGDKIVLVAEIENEIKDAVRTSGKNQMLLELDGRVPWKIWAKIQDAAKVADVTQVFLKRKKSPM